MKKETSKRIVAVLSYSTTILIYDKVWSETHQAPKVKVAKTFQMLQMTISNKIMHINMLDKLHYGFIGTI